MNNRTRFLKTMRFESVDHPPLTAGGAWGSTMRRWRQEGLPEGVSLEEYFKLEPLPVEPVAVDTLMCPGFKEQILEETEEYVVKINVRGTKERNYRHGNSMPEFIEYPIKGPADIAWLKEQLDPDNPVRIDPAWQEKAQKRRDAGAVLFCNGGMYFGFLNEHMGTEALIYTYYDSPDFIHQVNELLCSCCERALDTILPRFQLDHIAYHEDMAYKNGPMISPEMFREFMTPYYRRIAKYAEQYGLDYGVMDSDGDIRKLIPLWMEVGVNCFAPMEAAAGCDVVALRLEYGHDIRMLGGFDKRILASDKSAIKAELERLRPVIEEGGYIPGCDHGIPHDVSFDNYCYFIDCLKAMYGMV